MIQYNNARRTFTETRQLIPCKYVSNFMLNKSHINEYGIYCSMLKWWHLITHNTLAFNTLIRKKYIWKVMHRHQNTWYDLENTWFIKSFSSIIERNSYIKFSCVSKWFWKHLRFLSHLVHWIANAIIFLLTNVKRYPGIRTRSYVYSARIVCIYMHG